MSVIDDILQCIEAEDQRLFDKYPQIKATIEKLEANLQVLAGYADEWTDWRNQNWDAEAGMTRAERQLRELLAASHARLAQCLEQEFAPAQGKSEHNSSGAKRTLLERAEEGDPEAQYHLGYHYGFGPDEVRDYGLAIEWWTKSAEHGCVNAQVGLWLIYSEGLGVPQDHAMAYVWISVAADLALGESQKRFADSRDSTGGFLTPTQLAEAQDQALRLKTRIEASSKPEFHHVPSWDLDRYDSGSITDEIELAALEDHLVVCPKCRWRFRDMRVITRTLIAAGFTRRTRV